MPLAYTPPLRELLDIYMSANTPAYLYKRLRRHHHVRALAERNTPAMLAEEIRAVPRSTRGRGEDLVLAYACLAALSLHRDASAREQLQSLDVSRMNWGSYFVESAELGLVGAQRVTLDANPRAAVLREVSMSEAPSRIFVEDATPHANILPARARTTGDTPTLVIPRRR
jgi:hypothetical protein